MKPADVSEQLWESAESLAQFCSPGQHKHLTALTIARSITAAVAAEREACAVVVQGHSGHAFPNDIAAAIRARSTP